MMDIRAKVYGPLAVMVAGVLLYILAMNKLPW